MARKGGGDGKYKSRKTGQFVRAYHGKRNPKTCVKVEVPARERRSEGDEHFLERYPAFLGLTP